MTVHGSASTYTNHDCRCDDCRGAWASYQRDIRSRRQERIASDPALVTHGLSTTYLNWGCRCDECRAAHTAANAEWRATRDG